MADEAHIETLTKLAERLQYFNDWRRGAEIEMPCPGESGIDIDAAIEIIKEVIEEYGNGRNTDAS